MTRPTGDTGTGDTGTGDPGAGDRGAGAGGLGVGDLGLRTANSLSHFLYFNNNIFFVVL